MTATFDGTAVPETLGDGAELILGEGRTPVLGVTGPDLPGETVRALLGRYGALLVRGLGLAAPADLGRAAQALGVTPMTEREGFTGRTDFGDGVYGASEWPADEPMCMHHERSYGDEVPAIALFGCLTAPRTGGATAVADARTVLAKLPADIVERFARDGWRLARTYRDIGVSWAESFGHPGHRGGRRVLPCARPGPRVAAGRRAAHRPAPRGGGAPPRDR
ncbi:TauD/TfdA family dioxygenase [Streptomyces libani]